VTIEEPLDGLGSRVFFVMDMKAQIAYLLGQGSEFFQGGVEQPWKD